MNAWVFAAVMALVTLGLIVARRRRAARRVAEAEARARARRRNLPLVSSNLRGRSAESSDLWEDAGGATAVDSSGR